MSDNISFISAYDFLYLFLNAIEYLYAVLCNAGNKRVTEYPHKASLYYFSIISHAFNTSEKLYLLSALFIYPIINSV